MSLTSDLRAIYQMAFSRIEGASHSERLESFYRGQASVYDDTRKWLLKDRELLYQTIPFPKDGIWVDLGGGTGSNFEALGDRMRGLRQALIVDLSSSLLEVAQSRINERNWTTCRTLQADVTELELPEPADVITFSYSLTMIPNWFSALQRALALLKPGGHIGVVDFTVSAKQTPEGRAQHGWFTRNFWPIWFETDGIRPNRDHIPFLESHFQTVLLKEARFRIRYFPLVPVPYFLYVGKKPHIS